MTRPAPRSAAALLPLLLVIPLLAAPVLAGQSAARADDKRKTELVIDNGWFANMPNDGPTYGYFRISNGTETPRLITEFSAPACDRLKLEEAHGGGTNGHAAVTMTVPPKTRLVFSRGGYHLVCERGSHTLSVGDTVTVTVSLDGGTKINVDFAVRPFPH